ncbi:VWA domain-containing protein [Jannaschia ovalis]|uniref:VWA domain-containing protein n=1 Tax=Jannaschia ovalis TaxID=3038773 RepID=A0ABY8LD88_9RHOB|nr:VWA domain-containing protein [Jannaschia sp. GRR-S6-38]WGH79286.1 VWA domain-containing protein [Jannaschia sp. GRR-S6-38]
MAHVPFRSFRSDEDGALTIFGLFIFILMMVAGGIALDLMRSEVNRTALQNTADRAVLAAASATQPRNARDVVRDYLRAAGLDEDAIYVREQSDGVSKQVTLEANVETPSLFMNVFGIDQMVTPVSTSATEAMTTLEVALVLDISGSMGGSKISNMRTAANEFVAELLKDRETITNISVVPYNDRVNLGAALAGQLPMDATHSHNYCIVFEDADFTTTGIGAGTVLSRMAHFDKDTNSWEGNAPGLVADPHCSASDTSSAVLPWANNVTTLQTHINGLNAGAWTAMDLGVRTGMLLLDPVTRPALTGLVTAGSVSYDFQSQPAAFGAPGARKVLVVMTDGANTYQWDIKDQYKSGPSGVLVFDPSWAGTAAAIAAGTDVVPTEPIQGRGNWVRDGYPIVGWDEAPATDFIYSIWSERYQAYYINYGGSGFYSYEPFGGDDAVRIDYADLWANVSTDYLADALMRDMPRSDRNRMRRAWEQTHNQTSADTNLKNACAVARSRGIIIYTIAFQAPADGKKAMEDCAGEEYKGNYFDVQGLDIASAFDGILASMNRLRLVQ